MYQWRLRTVPQYLALPKDKREKELKLFRSRFIGSPIGIATVALPLISIGLAFALMNAIELHNKGAKAGIGIGCGALSVLFIPPMMRFAFARFIVKREEEAAIKEEKKRRRQLNREED